MFKELSLFLLFANFTIINLSGCFVTKYNLIKNNRKFKYFYNLKLFAKRGIRTRVDDADEG